SKAGRTEVMDITGMISLDNVFSPAVPDDAIVNADGKYYIFLVKEQEEESHDHKEGENHDHNHDHGSEQGTRFERMQITKGASQLGYTAVTPVREIPIGTHIVGKGAFFVNATMDDTGEHAHAH